MKYTFNENQRDEFIKKAAELEETEEDDFLSMITPNGFFILTGDDAEMLRVLALARETKE
jgi:hypothetical protein